MSDISNTTVNPPLVLAERDQPFWGFAEVFLVAALFIPAVVAGAWLSRKVSDYFHIDDKGGLPLLAAEFIGYAIIFVVLRILFARHGEPLLKSLGWVAGPFKPVHMIAVGVALAFFVVLLSSVLRIPEVETPFEKLLDDPVSRVAIALFGITLGPFVEELLFRGFLQPVMVNSVGVFPGILLTSIVFGGLHLMQNDFIWQSGVLITLVGFVLGVIRHISGSTRSSTIAHISYNALPFLAVLFSGGQTGHS
ncbi:MAG TPA: type II CAAX endopeptidase family protein [Bryobacteraceae bacterium]|nr:type II CAAX endopeptidase family protein [Bryobacteraceae bacterium]